jgi:uncharacterized Fe-S center protein
MEMTSDVYFADLSADRRSGVLERVDRLLARVGLGEADLDRRLVAVKIHFGEKGNNAYVRPLYVARLTAFLTARGARPFLTDTNTLYVGSRGDSVSHLRTALGNGFDLLAAGAPVIISGGLRGTDGRKVRIDGDRCAEVEIAPEILDADLIVGVTHFKGHEMTGFGGTLKNFGMGCASRGGKLAMHSRVSPRVVAATCTGCRQCFRWCAQNAIAAGDEGKAVIDAERCVGCGACLAVCPAQAITIVWDQETGDMQERMVEYARGALQAHLPDRAFFVNVVTQVSPLCDCYPFADTPVVGDIGILASRDPVALDQASVDLVNAAPGNEASSLPPEARRAGADKFRALHPKVDWEVQLRHAEKMGLGFRAYRLQPV